MTLPSMILASMSLHEPGHCNHEPDHCIHEPDHCEFRVSLTVRKWGRFSYCGHYCLEVTVLHDLLTDSLSRSCGM